VYRGLMRRVLIVSAIFLLLPIVVSFIATSRINALRDAITQFTEQELEDNIASSNFEIHIARTIAEAQTYLTTEEIEHLDEGREALQQAQEEVLFLDEGLFGRGETNELAREYQALNRQRQAIVNEVSAILTSLEGAEQDTFELRAAFDELEAFEGSIGDLRQATVDLLNQERAEVTGAVTARLNEISILSTVLISMQSLLIIASVVLIGYYIVRPVQALAVATEEVTQGNMHQQLPTNSLDEIGLLQRLFNRMVETIRQQTNSLNQQVSAAEEARRQATTARDKLAQQLAIIEQQRQVIQEMSVPLLPVGTRTLMMPLVGTLDDNRMRLVLEQALEGVQASRARWLILDVTGVAVIDSQVAQGLVQLVQALRLLGTRVVLVGIRPEVAQSLVAISFALDEVVVRSNLQSGVEYTLARS
jgi:rsbT co-antagonist protein RsbR